MLSCYVNEVVSKMKFKKMIDVLFQSGKAGVDWAKDKTLQGTAIGFLKSLKVMFRNNIYFKRLCDEALVIIRLGDSMSDEQEQRLYVLADEIQTFLIKKRIMAENKKDKKLSEKQKADAQIIAKSVESDLKKLDGYDQEKE